MQKNRFGYEIFDPFLVFDKNHQVLELIYKNMENLFLFLGDSKDFRFARVMDLCTKAFNSVKDPYKLVKVRHETELSLKESILSSHMTDRLADAFDERAYKITGQIADMIKQMLPSEKISIADVGCGDGLVAYHLKEKIGDKIGKFLLADVLDYRSNRVINDAFIYNLLSADGYRHIDPVSETNAYNLILVGTVLHHTNNPESVINACYRSLKDNGVLVIVESCIGINKNLTASYQSITGGNVADNSNIVKSYIEMSLEEQMMYGIFIDWFYNRVLHKNVNIPFNFNTPLNWNDIICSYPGMKTEVVYFEGFDQITVPEFHTIHFYRKHGK